jgi:hypothetical protein
MKRILASIILVLLGCFTAYSQDKCLEKYYHKNLSLIADTSFKVEKLFDVRIVETQMDIDEFLLRNSDYDSYLADNGVSGIFVVEIEMHRSSPLDFYDPKQGNYYQIQTILPHSDSVVLAGLKRMFKCLEGETFYVDSWADKIRFFLPVNLRYFHSEESFYQKTIVNNCIEYSYGWKPIIHH